MLTRRGIRYSPASAGRVVDVRLDGQRVWSCAIPEGGRFLPWPSALQERLRGRAVGEIVDAVTAKALWRGAVRWPGTGPMSLTDAEGHGLRIDKWGRLTRSFEYGTDIRPHVAALAASVIEILHEQDYDAFIVGGTLLGAVRDGEILPHDDDADVAYLSRHSHPSDLILESHRLQGSLQDRGFRVLRHSWSHLQVLADDSGGYYVDIFTAFYKSGHFHEPIHVREAGMEAAILPLTTQEVHGIRLPAPRQPEAWLAACYGPSWRTPDPSFTFETPPATQRRFHAWFGAFYSSINLWKTRYAAGGSAHESETIRTHVIAAGDNVIDLGSGDGEDLAFYRSAGLRAAGAESISAARSVRDGEAQVNLVEYLPSFAFMRRALHESTGSCVVAANHLLACLDERGRSELLHLLSFALRQGARVITADYEELGRYEPDSPRTWHLDWTTRTAEATKAGLRCVPLERARFRDEDGVRRTVAVVEYHLEEM